VITVLMCWRWASMSRPDEVNAHFTEMCRIAVDLGDSAKDVVCSRDPEQAAQLSHDDAMNDVHRHLFTVLMDRR
jgi:phosphate transport system protein